MIRPPEIVRLWKGEFQSDSLLLTQRDRIAGLTVGAVALSLALAFGVADGSTPTAGLITAIIAGLVIGILGGAAYQISAPAGAMSTVRIVIMPEHGPRGSWLARTMAGIMILAVSVFGLGPTIHSIPAPVITGFTRGIALTITIGQIDNFCGFKTPAKDRASGRVDRLFHALVATDQLEIGLCRAG